MATTSPIVIDNIQEVKTAMESVFVPKKKTQHPFTERVAEILGIPKTKFWEIVSAKISTKGKKCRETYYGSHPNWKRMSDRSSCDMNAVE